MKAIRSILFLLSGLSLAAAEENYAEWAYSRDIALDTSPAGANVAADQTGFPLLVSLTAQQADVFAQAKAGGADLRFATAEGRHLPYQIELWDAAGGKAAIWVKADTVKGGSSSQHLRLYWGKAAAADSSNGKAVFPTAGGYLGVWHLGAGLEDATANGFDGMDSGATAAPEGRIGGGRYFNNPDAYAATGKYIALRNPGGVNLAGRITLEAWVKWTRRDGHRIILCHGAAPGSDFETVLRIGETKDYRSGVWTGSSHYATLAAPAADSNAWVHLAGAYSGSAWILYRNGAKVSELADTNGAKPSPGAWRIGAEYASNAVTRYFCGWLDEVRVSNVARNADWIKLTYENQKDGQSLIRIGPTMAVALGRKPSRSATRAGDASILSRGEKVFRLAPESGHGVTASGSRRSLRATPGGNARD